MTEGQKKEPVGVDGLRDCLSQQNVSAHRPYKGASQRQFQTVS